MYYICAHLATHAKADLLSYESSHKKKSKKNYARSWSSSLEVLEHCLKQKEPIRLRTDVF